MSSGGGRASITLRAFRVLVAPLALRTDRSCLSGRRIVDLPQRPLFARVRILILVDADDVHFISVFPCRVYPPCSIPVTVYTLLAQSSLTSVRNPVFPSELKFEAHDVKGRVILVRSRMLKFEVHDE